MKGFLKRCQRSLRSTSDVDLAFAREHLEESAAAVAKEGVTDQDEIDYYFVKQRYAACKEEWASFSGNVGIEQTVTAAEKSSKFFFRPPRFELRHTRFRSIRKRDGMESHDPTKISTGFQEYWGQVFGNSRFVTDNNVDMSSQERLLDSIDRTLSPEGVTSLEWEFTGDDLASP